MFAHGIEILWLRRRQLQHHVNGVYLLRGGTLSGWCNETIRDL